MDTEFNNDLTDGDLEEVTLEGVPEGADFDFLDNEALEAFESEPTGDTPLPAASPQEEGAGSKESQAGGPESDEAEFDEFGEPKAERAGSEEGAADDEEARDPEAASDGSEPEAEGGKGEGKDGEAAKKSKPAKFETHFTGSEKTPTEIVDYLAGLSAERFGALEKEIVKRRMGDADGLLSFLHETDPEGYGKLALQVYEGASDYFTELVTKRKGLTAEQVQEALDFKERHKGTEPVELLDAGEASLSEDEFTDLEAWDGDIAAKVKALQNEAAKASPVEGQGVQPDALVAERDQAFDAGREHITAHLRQKATTAMRLGVTDSERTHAPAVATLKDVRLGLLMAGVPGLLPGFEEGLAKWGESRKEFTDGLVRMHQASLGAEKPDRAAVVAASEGLFEEAGLYLEERLTHPIFRILDQAISREVAAVKKRPAPPAHIPGSTRAGSQARAGETQLQRLTDDLDALALASVEK